jgi:hypothetical protein
MAWLRPWPRAAPVMKATLPSTRPVIVVIPFVEYVLRSARGGGPR